MNQSRRSPVAIAVVAMTLVSGCAQIIHGRFQTIAVSSDPARCKVFIDGMNRGETPLNVTLRRGGPKKEEGVPRDFSKMSEHHVRLELQGYEPFEMTLERRVSGWVWGNILLGGLIGLAIDGGTGAMYKIVPEHVVANLDADASVGAVTQDAGPERFAFDQRGDTLFITVVMRANPAWEHVATLERISEELRR